MVMRCTGVTRGGKRCTLPAVYDGYCHLHTPLRAAERRRNASKAGRSRGRARGELQALKDKLARLIESVETGRLDPKRAGAIAQLTNAALRALELERRWRETEELAGRIERLEERVPGGDGHVW